MRLVSTTVYLEPLQYASLRALSEKTKIPMATFVRNGVDLILKREELRAASAAPRMPKGAASS